MSTRLIHHKTTNEVLFITTNIADENIRLVDEITYKLAADAKDAHTQSAILGPFFRHDTPMRQKGDTISFDTPKDGQLTYMYGTVLDASTKKPIANAEIDVWEASTNGLYEQQDPNQEEHNLRGKFRTDENGEYAFYCLKPTPYPVPDDGPAGELLQMMDRHPFRPAHIHILVSYLTMTSQFRGLISCKGHPSRVQAHHHPDL